MPRVNDPNDLERFLDAQKGIYESVLQELQTGAKQGHWMWFIFPQLDGLGRSPTAIFYAIRSSGEARAYLGHPVLGPRLRECTQALLPWSERRSADEILGQVDALKLRSSLTLFDRIEPHGVFAVGLAAFFEALRDERTLALLNAAR